MPKDPASPASLPRTDRIPPSSEEAERGVLGSVLLDSARVMDLAVAGQIVAESFYVPAHRAIYEAMLEMSRDNRPIDALTVSEKLKDMGRLEAIGGAIFLDRLIDSTPTAAHAEYYIDIVRQKYLLRRVIECAMMAQAECHTSEDSADAILARAEQSFFDITEQQHGSVSAWPEVVKAAMGHIEIIARDHTGITGIATNFKDIDAELCGLKPGNMCILAARPSMGKTSLAMNIVQYVASGEAMPDRNPRPVGIFSLEMSKEDLVMRMLCTVARVSSHKLAGYVSGDNHRMLVQAADELVRFPIYLDDTAGLDVMELRARARRMRKKHDIRFLVVDYLQLLHARDYTRQGRQVEISAVSGSLKAMAKELNIPIMVISQLSRAPETRGERTGKPRLSDLRDSGSIEQDADVVLLLRRPCKYEEDPDHEDRTLAIVDIAKNRNGPTRDDIRLVFDEEVTLFKDRAHGVDERDAERAAGGEQ